MHPKLRHEDSGAAHFGSAGCDEQSTNSVTLVDLDVASHDTARALDSLGHRARVRKPICGSPTPRVNQRFHFSAPRFGSEGVRAFRFCST
jgi:hypothetical protein